VTGGVKDVREEVAEAGLAVRSGDADDLEALRGIAVEGGGKLGQTAARVGQNEEVGAAALDQRPPEGFAVFLDGDGLSAGLNLPGPTSRESCSTAVTSTSPSPMRRTPLRRASSERRMS